MTQLEEHVPLPFGRRVTGHSQCVWSLYTVSTAPSMPNLSMLTSPIFIFWGVGRHSKSWQPPRGTFGTGLYMILQCHVFQSHFSTLQFMQPLYFTLIHTCVSYLAQDFINIKLGYISDLHLQPCTAQPLTAQRERERGRKRETIWVSKMKKETNKKTEKEANHPGCEPVPLAHNTSPNASIVVLRRPYTGVVVTAFSPALTGYSPDVTSYQPDVTE